MLPKVKPSNLENLHSRDVESGVIEEVESCLEMIEEKFIWISAYWVISGLAVMADSDGRPRPDPDRNFMTIITELRISMIEF